MMEGVSAIIPVRNGERYLGEAIESVLGQRPAPLELIVVDDGSSDGSGDVARGFGEAVIVVSQPPAGVGGALNAGLERARGELIGFLDADDLWTAGKLELQVASLEREPGADYVIGAAEQFHSPDLEPEQRARIRNPTGRARGQVRGAMLARASCFERIGGFDERRLLGEFIDWIARADEAGLRRLVGDEIVLRRRLHDAHMTMRREAFADYAKVLAEARARRKRGGRS